ncbi:MAG: hypothetical protein MJ227_02095 [Bacilli bacterium]|nr:hypothetical protein [Bacilli bacterium]
MKKFKKILLVFGMALCLGGGVGAAVAAVTSTPATGSGTGNFDQAINLRWEQGQASTTLVAMPDLKVNEPKYRYLTVSPEATSAVAGTVKLTFTLAVGEVETEKTATIKGLTVAVYETTELATDETVKNLIKDVDPKFTLGGEKLTDTISITVEAGKATPQSFYAMEVTYDGTGEQGKVLAGKLTISQSFVA